MRARFPNRGIPKASARERGVKPDLAAPVGLHDVSAVAALRGHAREGEHLVREHPGVWVERVFVGQEAAYAVEIICKLALECELAHGREVVDALASPQAQVLNCTAQQIAIDPLDVPSRTTR